MKNLFKKLLIGLAMGLILIHTAVLPLDASAAVNLVDGKYEADGNVKGKAGIILKADFTQEELDSLGPEFIVNIKDHGWEQTSTGLQKFYPAQPNSLKINEENIAISDEGEFSINENSDELEINFEANGQKLRTTISLDKDLNNIDIIKTIDFKDFMEDMGPEAEGTIGTLSEIGEKQYPGDYVHCVRFNGFYSDNVYYAHDSVKGLRNFIGSDCDHAFLAYNCEKDYTAQTNCRGLQAAYNYTNCSKALGHTQRYHWYDNQWSGK